MLTATFFFLAISLFAIAACFARAQRTVAASARNTLPPTLSRKAERQEIKAAWAKWHERCREIELKEKAMLSWGSTMALCAAICVIGLIMQAELEKRVPPDGQAAVQSAVASTQSPKDAAN